ncbi:hypothetical protein D3C77_497370 [compost metagenome]
MGNKVAGTVTGIELLGQDAFPCRAAGTGRARQAAHQRAIGQPGQSAGLHRGGADVEDRQGAEQLAKPVNMLVEQTGHRLGGAVAGGKTGATGHQHHLHLVVGDPGRHLRTDFVDIVLEQLTGHQAMAHFHRASRQQFARGVGGKSAGITDGQYGDVDRYENRIHFHTHVIASGSKSNLRGN